MFQLWKARRGRRIALAILRPLVEGTEARLGRIPSAAWHDAYIVGFLSMLASLEARAALGGSIGSLALGLIQCETIADLSGEAPGIHGEEIMNLSTEGDRRFLEGCSQAAIFHVARQRSRLGSTAVPGDTWESCGCHLQDDLLQLWRDVFEERVAALL
ncbi:hypothetical protein [Microvirga thermotolerans]|uniref:Uncharacterized protein n=1 Tax=Microvirga thermotolerans TaxID=2651334 RepID=A0A5P9JYL9_9HYPH|nr:hypothetical protein [Microvirga thermotolerans]QFU17349.1 hypothetical protein GDR74_14580 [Microvirga thermotolerans]